MKKIAFASSNEGKVRELKDLLKSYFFVQGLKDLDIKETWEETGKTFKENALIKIRGLGAVFSGELLADDSGLCVDALDGAPGVHSARWTRGNLCQKLLQKLEGLPLERRRAYFVCFLVYRNTEGEDICFEGRLDGTIAFEERGSEGLGYDPIFIPEGELRTLGEMSLQEKAKISHRGKAVEKFLNFLKS